MATISPDSNADALRRLTTADPPQWLKPNAELSAAARAAGCHLFSSLRPYASKSSFERLLTENFDHEQIWQQIDLQSQPLVSSLRREVKHFQKDQEEIWKIRASVAEKGENMETEDFGEELKKLDGDFDEFEEESDDEEMEESEEEPVGQAEEGDNNGGPIEDKFLKIKDLEDFLEDEDAREYGHNNNGDNEAEEDGDDDEEEDELGEFGLDGDDEEDGEDDKMENARYDDFFGAKAKPSKKKPKLLEGSEDSASDDEKEDDIPRTLSTHEKEQIKNRLKIEQMERENMEPKSWTMQGEVTATKRPKNSALEVELDFQHNVGPPPVFTQEIAASLEEMIKNRIAEGVFDDVRKAPSQPTKARREVKEMDENKSKKGLGEVMEEEFVTTSTGFAPISFAEEQKKEASLLFKKLCLKLDALSHFHFTPKPVIEDMAIPTNVPALAIEEIAPLAVSDAAMLAPEEVFAGKGDIKEEVELSQAERKRRRATKKRKFKAATEKKMANKPRDSTLPNNKDEGEKITTTRS